MFYVDPINRKALNGALRVLKEAEPTIVADLRKELRTALVPFADTLAKNMPAVAPVSNLAKSPGYRQPRGKAGFTPGGKKSALVYVALDAGAEGRGFYISEMAGTRTSGLTGRGRALIDNLNNFHPNKPPAGRFAWPMFLRMLPDAYARAQEILDRTMVKLEKSID